METTIFTKTIKYDRESKDFAMYLNGELIGYTASYLQAEIELNSLVHDILTHTAVADTSDVADEDVEALLVSGNESPATPAAAVANAPIIAIYRELGQTNASIEPNGSLVFTPSGMDARFITLKPRDTYELYTFLAKHPLVVTMLEHLEAERQLEDAQDYITKPIPEYEHPAFRRGWAAALEFIKNENEVARRPETPAA